jgi:putative transposase
MPRIQPRRRYPSDLTDAQWALLEAAMPLATHGRTGRPRKYPLREVWNAIFYLARNGCTWRALPHDLPPWEVVWDHFRRWRANGTFEHLNGLLREEVRAWAGKERTPSLAIIDAQSVKTTEKGGRRASTRASWSRAASGTSS